MNDKQIEKARIQWRCKRGMLELDLILLPYFERYYDTLTPVQQLEFTQLLTANDPELFAWLLGFEVVSRKELEAIVQHIRARM